MNGEQDCFYGPGSRVGIVLGGTHIWRADPAQCLASRPLVPVANTPLIYYSLQWLKQAGVQAAVICVNEGAALMRRYLGDGSARQLPLQYYTDRMPRGPAGCIRDASQAIPAKEYVVVEGSIIPTMNARQLLAAHRHTGALVTMGAQGSAGNGDGRADGATPAGTYVFAREALEHVPPHGYQDIKETLLPRLLREGARVCVFPAREPVPRVTGLTTYLAAQEWALRHAAELADLLSGYVWHDTTAIHATASVARSARIIGPAMIGPGTFVEDNALLIGPVVTGWHCQIGPAALVMNAVLWDAAVIENGARVESCVIASGARVARNATLRGLLYDAGTKVSRPSLHF